MKDKTKNSLIINLLGNFWIVIVVSIVLIIYYSLGKFDFLPEGFPILLYEPKDIVSATLTFIGICIAFNGLNTWQSQLRGKYDFDLVCQSMRDISNIRIAYTNFSTMWNFFPLPSKNETIVIRLYVLDSHFQKLNELRAEINKFRTIKNEIEAAWDDFPHDYMHKMLIKANSYLANAENFISYCHSEMKDNHSPVSYVSFVVSDKKDPMGRMFLYLCSDILIETKEIKLPSPSDFRKNYIDFLSAYEHIRLYLDKKIKKYNSTIG